MIEKPDCYGGMFPDMDTVEHNRQVSGRAFGVRVDSQGIGIAGRSVSVDREGWAQCRGCESYGGCYDLSMAKLALGTALHVRT
jgi:hypothetical protein